MSTVAPENYFTVGVIVDFQAPEKAKSGKVYMNFKLGTLIKHSLHHVRKLLPFPHTPL